MDNNQENNSVENIGNNSEGISRKLLIFDSVLIVLIVFMVFLIYSLYTSPVRRNITQSDQSEEITIKPVFEDIKLTAKSAYVFDITTNKVIFKKNEFVQLPLASLTKLMTALTASELLPPDSRVIIKKEFLREEGDTGLLSDESWKLKDLLDFSLVVSSNDGARSVASVVGAFDLKSDDYELGRKYFITKMNLKAQELGLKQTYFVNESGLDIGSTSGGYGSAIDVAKLMKYILTTKPELIEATKYPTIIVDSLDKTHKIENTNTDIGDIPGLIASKTGYTDMAGGNLVVAFDASMGKPIIVVVLGSTLEGRFEDVANLVNASLKYVSQ
ncbi:MAG: hypothetical protein WAX85_02520 [Minisyncoccia bacterium]